MCLIYGNAYEMRLFSSKCHYFPFCFPKVVYSFDSVLHLGAFILMCPKEMFATDSKVCQAALPPATERALGRKSKSPLSRYVSWIAPNYGI